MNRGSIRVLGRAQTKVLRTFAWMARNLRILEAFTRSHPRGKKEHASQARPRRRTRTVATLLPSLAAADPPANGPPPTDQPASN